MSWNTILLLSSVSAQSVAILGSVAASQSAVTSLSFILASPNNCLSAPVDLRTNNNTNIAALWIRAAFHDAGTWSPNTANPGGLDASILSFLDAEENAGIANSTANLNIKVNDLAMSNSDKIALGAQVAVTHCGGPLMSFRPGRLDATTPTSPVGLIPPGNSRLSEVRSHFERMGWTNEDIVALVTGSHTMGGVHGRNSPSVTNKTFIPFDDTAGIFDNHVFKFTLQGKCAIPLDCDIANDPDLRPIVQRFANNQTEFFNQYKISFQKLLGQTSSPLGAEQSLEFKVHKFSSDTIKQPPLNFDPSPAPSPTSTPEGNGKKEDTTAPVPAPIAITVGVVVFVFLFFAIYYLTKKRRIAQSKDNI